MTKLNLPKNRPPTHPGEMLYEEFLKPLSISQTEFAEQIGVSYVRLNAIINGRRGITPNTALRLERATGMDAAFWLSLQTGWDLWHELKSPEAAAIRKIDRLPGLPRRARNQIRNVPDYLLAEARRALEKPTPAEMRTRLGRRARADLGESPAAAVRRERDAQ